MGEGAPPPPHCRTKTEAPLLFSCRRPPSSPPPPPLHHKHTGIYSTSLAHLQRTSRPWSSRHVTSLVQVQRSVKFSTQSRTRCSAPLPFQFLHFGMGGVRYFSFACFFRPEKDFVAGLQKMTGMPHHVCLLQDPEPDMSLCPGRWEPIVSR